MDGVALRPYEAADRARVREICCATGFLGDPVAWFWRDAESFADVFSRYYTDEEPESLLVAVRGGRVEGYLFGCVDAARADGVQSAALRVALSRGLPLRPGTAGFFWRSAFDVLRDRAGAGAELRDARWPAHLHVNLTPDLRGRGVGAALMTGWLERLRAQGVAGVHLTTWAENEAALAFFERMGFARHGDARRAPGFRTRDGARMHRQVMVRGC